MAGTNSLNFRLNAHRKGISTVKGLSHGLMVHFMWAGLHNIEHFSRHSVGRMIKGVERCCFKLKRIDQLIEQGVMSWPNNFSVDGLWHQDQPVGMCGLEST